MEGTQDVELKVRRTRGSACSDSATIVLALILVRYVALRASRTVCHARSSPSSRVWETQVKLLDGTTFLYRVNASTTVAELKEKVSKDTGIPANLQRIIFRGKVLKDGLKLSEQKGVLDGGSVLHVVSRPPSEDTHSSGAATASGQQQQPAAAGTRAGEPTTGVVHNRDGTIPAGPVAQATMNLAVPAPANFPGAPGQPVLVGGFTLGPDGGLSLRLCLGFALRFFYRHER